MAPPDRFSELPADLTRLATGSQRIHPPGPRLHRPRREKKADIVRVYLPPTPTRCSRCRSLPSQPRLRQRNRCRKAAGSAVLDMESAIQHCTAGSHLDWASTDQGAEPDVVMACAGDIPTLETLAAVDLLRRHFSDIKIRVVNVVDLMTIQPQPNILTALRP